MALCCPNLVEPVQQFLGLLPLPGGFQCKSGKQAAKMRRQVCTAAPDGAELPCERSTDRIKVPVLDLGRVHFSRRSEEHTSELQSLMRISYAVFCLKKKNTTDTKERKT